jgi:DNA mismatch repair protein MutL
MSVDVSNPPGLRPIRRLEPLLVNQIAAGEVVERPASVVKELVENSIDAGARTIRIELEQGGIELIRITDDGHGIPEAELPLAIAPHATSKIREAPDLDRIATMGFRGEALASITSVARLTIRSRTAAQASAAEIAAEGEQVFPIRPAAGPVGTQVTVRNLFFNTPARRKFLRLPTTEQGHCVDTALTIAIAHPAIGFTLVCDGRVVLDLPRGQAPKQRVLDGLGRELAKHLLEVSADRFDDARGLTLWGLIGTPEIARGTAKAQHLYLNGRAVRDRTLQHAIREAYRGLIEPGRYPTAVLMIEMDPGAVDVNVHPAKAEVRFRDQSMVHGVVLRAVRDALRAADLTPRDAGAGGAGFGGQPEFGPRTSGGAAAGEPYIAPRPVYSPAALAEFLRRRPGAPSPAPTGHVPVSYTALREVLDTPAASEPINEPSTGASPGVSIAAEPEPSPLSAPKPEERLLQVHNSFVVTQDEHGLLIVDQHALHERVMFEALLARVTGGGVEGLGGTLESQRLLMPATIELSPAQSAMLNDLQPILDRVGVTCEPIGPRTIAVHSYPTFLFERGVEPHEFLMPLFEKIEAEGLPPGREEALHEVLDMMACKAAIKAGDRLSETEIRDLLKFRETVERSSNCPHGRPTSIRLTIRELEKRFGRS